jgi:hypothetical protein
MGSGTSAAEINHPLKQYKQMQKMMKDVQGKWLRATPARGLMRHFICKDFFVPVGAVLLTAKVTKEVTMNLTKLARISALALVLFLSALSAFAEPPCGCNYCQRFPERTCTTDGTVTTCAQFLTVALCPAAPAATSADALSSEASFFAAISGPTQEPAGCLNPTN